ncbi:GTP-binding protein [Sporothrix schenckii 1099-18]|uniref:GTP-binding protein n=1 Tax=Sporothrix schenckii 1099-18 TaxID=1397361 RepID=A0A0F2M6Q7_SPOSC|nr:GTP-binding protein [Sporothrix schenckii 1099-18]KJR85317.1 GTP-binding protein [Sporothrix schenckii 1099-18]
MKSHLWHDRVAALSPQVWQMVAKTVRAPTFASTSGRSYSSATSTRPFFHAGVPNNGCRAISSSCRNLTLAQQYQPRTKQALRPKAAPVASSKSRKATPPKTAAKSSPKPPKASNPASKTKTTPNVSRQLSTKPRVSKDHGLARVEPSHHIRAVAFLPPPTDADAVAMEAAAAAVRLAPTPTSAVLDRASSVFSVSERPESGFLYSAPRFLHMPRNTRIPEICILGRSNVGKSTLVNALAGLESGGKAGRANGSNAGRKGLAVTSARAGCTRMMNAYGFGPPLRAAQAQTFARVQEEEEQRRARGVPEASKSGVLSRSQKRAQSPGEPSPAHSLILIDMPGYGFMSEAEWGTEIAKYLERRATLRGAVLLVDAVAGLKDGDRQALEMLRDANVRTTIVLTKADKLLLPKQLRRPATVAPVTTAEPAFGSGTSTGEQALRAGCVRIWRMLRRVERESLGTVPWMEGQGWVPEIVVTGAGDPRGGGFGVAGARLAICRMAGLMPQHESAAAAPSSSRKQKKAGHGEGATNNVGASSGTVVPFDQIRWSEKVTEAVIDQAAELAYISRQEAERQERKARRVAAASAAEAKAESQSAPVGRTESASDPVEVGSKSPLSRGRRRRWKRA